MYGRLLLLTQAQRRSTKRCLKKEVVVEKENPFRLGFTEILRDVQSYLRCSILSAPIEVPSLFLYTCIEKLQLHGLSQILLTPHSHT